MVLSQSEKKHPYAIRLQQRLHTRQLHDYLDGNHNELIRRSILGLPQVYNDLPQDVVDETTVAKFQKKLQNLVKNKVQNKEDGWENCLNLRKACFAF